MHGHVCQGIEEYLDLLGFQDLAVKVLADAGKRIPVHRSSPVCGFAQPGQSTLRPCPTTLSQRPAPWKARRPPTSNPVRRMLPRPGQRPLAAPNGPVAAPNERERLPLAVKLS